MSISGNLGSKPESPYALSDPPENDNLDEIPPDPLLKSGAFIDINVDNGETLAESDAVLGDGKRHTDHSHRTPEPPQVRHSSNGCGAPEFLADNSNSAEVATLMPVPENAVSAMESRPRRVRKRKFEKSRLELAVASASSSETPDWLPPGWFIEDRVRCSGATAGLIDKYYVEPVSGHRFRSKKEVHYFLQTGTIRKKKSMDNPDVDIKSLGSSADRKHKRPASNFNFVDVPEKITWVLTDSSEDSWTPLNGDEKVPEFERQEWAAAFQFLAV